MRARIDGGFDLARRGSKESPFGKQVAEQVDFAAKLDQNENGQTAITACKQLQSKIVHCFKMQKTLYL